MNEPTEPTPDQHPDPDLDLDPDLDPDPDLTEPEPTGQASVDAALRAVAEVAGAPPADQLPAYQATHRVLRETLASIDEG